MGELRAAAFTKTEELLEGFPLAGQGQQKPQKEALCLRNCIHPPVFLQRNVFDSSHHKSKPKFVLESWLLGASCQWMYQAMVWVVLLAINDVHFSKPQKHDVHYVLLPGLPWDCRFCVCSQDESGAFGQTEFLRAYMELCMQAGPGLFGKRSQWQGRCGGTPTQRPSYQKDFDHAQTCDRLEQQSLQRASRTLMTCKKQMRLSFSNCCLAAIDKARAFGTLEKLDRGKMGRG